MVDDYYKHFKIVSITVPPMIFVLFVLSFYDPATHFGSFQAQSVYLMLLNNVIAVHDSCKMKIFGVLLDK